MKTLTQFVTSTSTAGTSNVVGKIIDQFTSNAITWLERFRPFLESSVTGGSDSLSFIPPEILLIIPAINKKVELGTATPMECVIAALLHDIQSLFTVDTSAPKSAATTSPSSRPAGVQTQEVQKKFLALVEALPMLCDVKTLFSILEVPALAQRAIRSFWAASKTSTSDQTPAEAVKEVVTLFVEWLVPYLDTRSWFELSATLDEIIKRKAIPPRLQAIIDAASSNKGIIGSENLSLWARALVVTLASRKVYFNRTIVLQMRLVGITGLEKALSFSQHRRSTEQSTDEDETNLPIAQALEPLIAQSINEVTMQEGKFHDLHNVQELISAHYGYTSLTTAPVDVTEIIAKRLSNSTLFLANFPTHELQRQRESVPGLDRFRKKLTFNVSELTIKYKPAIETDPAYIKKVNHLLSQLTETGWVKPLHQKDGHFTWFKLPEWMQVEMVQVFGESMTHTPWYRFPFMRFISLYFQVLLKEVGIVQSKFGVAKALFSNAFLTDLVPGLAMFFMFLQLQLLALPVKSVAGTEYTQELLVEQIVLLAPSTDNIKWRHIDDRISAQRVVSERGLYILTIPTFKPFTEVILKIARTLPHSQILEISNQQTIQAKVILPKNSTTPEAEAILQAKIAAINGCSVMFDYRYPIDATSASQKPRLCVSVSVATMAIIRFVNVCDRLGIEIDQMYDFYA